MTPAQQTAINVAVAVACFGLACSDLGRRGSGPSEFEMPGLLLLYAAATLPSVVRSKAPTLVLMIQVAAVTATTALGRTPLALDVALGFAAYLVAATGSRRRGVVVLLVGELLLGSGVIVALIAHTAGDYVIHSMLAVGALWFAGDGTRSYRALERTTAERNRLLDAERAEHARRAAEEDRIAIAREVHDVVAHSLTVIAVQAGVGARLGDAAETRSTLNAIESASRTAQAELRGVLALLRRDDQEAPRSPAPTLADLQPLVQQVRDAGTPVSLDVQGVGLLPGVTQVTLFRIVQEALTNVVKHAPGAATDVTLTSADGSVALRIENSAPASRASDRRSSPTPGRGLGGMRERVTAFGGTISAGPSATGGFLVAVGLPLPIEADRAV